VNGKEFTHAPIMTDFIDYCGLPWGELVGKGLEK